MSDNHLWVEITDQEWKANHRQLTPVACWNCGLYKSVAGIARDCHILQQDSSMVAYMEGGLKDPFKNMRPATASVRLACDDIESAPEDIPGITDTGIDKDAYNEFMKGL